MRIQKKHIALAAIPIAVAGWALFRPELLFINQTISEKLVLAHAARCTGCGNFLTRMRVTLEALRQARERETNSGAMDRLRDQIRQLEQGS